MLKGSQGVKKFRSQNSEFRSQKLSIWSGSPVGLDCARVGNKQLGDLFEEGLHICCGRVSQILNQNRVVSTLFEGALCEVEKPCFFRCPALCNSFCDVRRNGNRRAPLLARKAIDLASRKACCQ